MSILPWLAFMFALLGCIINARKSIWCWPVWTLANILWITYAVSRAQWALSLQEFTFISVNAYGWRSWRRSRSSS